MTGKFRTQCALAPPVSRLPTRSRYISDSNATHHTTRVPLPSQSKFSITSTTNFLACTALHDKTPCQHLRNISLTHIGRRLEKKKRKSRTTIKKPESSPHTLSAREARAKSQAVAAAALPSRMTPLHAREESAYLGTMQVGGEGHALCIRILSLSLTTSSIV